MTKANARQADELRDEIQQTRAELGHTVQALAGRADVPARMRASATHTADRTRESAMRVIGRVRGFGATPMPWLALSTGSTLALLMVLVRWRKASRSTTVKIRRGRR